MVREIVTPAEEPREKEPYAEPLVVKHEPLRELTGKSPEKTPNEKNSEKTPQEKTTEKEKEKEMEKLPTETP